MDGEDTLSRINNSYILGAKLTDLFHLMHKINTTLMRHEHAITLTIMGYPQKRSIHHQRIVPTVLGSAT